MKQPTVKKRLQRRRNAEVRNWRRLTAEVGGAFTYADAQAVMSEGYHNIRHAGRRDRARVSRLAAKPDTLAALASLVAAIDGLSAQIAETSESVSCLAVVMTELKKEVSPEENTIEPA